MTNDSQTAPAGAWIGLKTSDDIGTKFDFLAEVLKNGVPVASTQLNGQASGSSGFNNALLRALATEYDVASLIGPSDELAVRLSVRIAVGVAGHRRGTARLWYGDAGANSAIDLTASGVSHPFYLADGFVLSTNAGGGPRSTIDVTVDRAVDGNPFRPFGTWVASPGSFLIGHWSTQAPMPTGRRDQGVETLNGLLYAVGGIDGNFLTTLEVYDPALGAWSTKSPMPNARYQPATAALNGLLYVVGGYAFGSTLNSMDVYDPATDSWTSKAPMVELRRCASAAVLNGKLYVLGGANTGNATAVATVEMYDPATDTWVARAPLPSARFCSTAQVVNGILYLIGGYSDAEGVMSRVDAYDPATDSWSSRAPMPTARYSFAVGVIGGVIYAAGGDGPTDVLSVVESYDPATNAWTTTYPPMPTARGDISGGNMALNGVLYGVGGSPVHTSATWLAVNEAFVP